MKHSKYYKPFGGKYLTGQKYSCECGEMHLAAGCPPGSRGCDPLFQLSPHMHARVKNSLSSDRVGPGKATAAVREAVECPWAGAFPSPTFLSTD